jgi:rod shape-determining protein MreD
MVIRLWVLGVVAVILQLAAVSQITLLGVSADIVPIVVVATGLLVGSIPGACMGFGMGLLLDLALVQTLGVDSLVLVFVGYFAGRFRELRDPSHGLIPVAAGAVGTAGYLIGFSLIQFLLGVDAPVSFLLVREILATVLVNMVIALPVYAIVRRVLGPYLPDDPRRRRRRAYTTGGLSPITRS